MFKRVTVRGRSTKRCSPVVTESRSKRKRLSNNNNTTITTQFRPFYTQFRNLAKDETSLRDSIDRYSAYKQTPVTIKQLIDFVNTSDNAFKSCLFLRSELPIRLAHMVKEFDEIEPQEVLETKSAKEVRGWYIDSFKDLMSYPSEEQMRSSSDPERVVTDFTKIINQILNRHSNVVQTMSHGILELKEKSPDLFNHAYLHHFLDRFYTSRIGIRLLMQQHNELVKMKSQTNNNKNNNNKEENYGVLEKKCNPARVARDAAKNAELLCMQTYSTAPNYEIVTPTASNGAVIEFPYVPSHLYHILFELSKNSMRAVVEKHALKKMPPIKIIIVEGKEDLTIKIADEGGGIKRSGMPHIFTYLYTTAPMPQEDSHYTDAGHAPLAGFGYGLPLSRLYARYLGGDMSVISIEGFGTDAYVYLKRAAAEAGEVLPSYTPVSSKKKRKFVRT